jgi:hypothetical protein
MKTIIKALWCILVLAVSASAANYTVKAGGGGNYSTIQSCASAMSAGDTCTVFAGTYNENVTVPAGTVGNYNTIQANGSDVVTVTSFTLNSHDRLEGNCPQSAAINTCGFNIQNPSAPTSTTCVSIVDNSTDIYIDNNVMYACNTFVHENYSANAGTNATYVRIRNNTMSWAGSTSSSPNVGQAMQLLGNHHLLQGNDISHVSDGPYIAGQYTVFLNNKFHDTNSSECGSNSSNCHIDFMQADLGDNYPEQYFLDEGSQVYNMQGSNQHAGPLLQCNSGQTCGNYIIRYKMAYTDSGGALTNDSSPGWPYVKGYNNTYVNMGALTSGAEVLPHNGACSNGSDLNEIFYNQGTFNGSNAYDFQSSSTPGATYGHSLAFATGGGTIYGHNYGSGAFTSDPGNLGSDPTFVNVSGNDFHLQSGSPAIGAGTNLTTANGSGASSTTLVVGDASFFQDSYGFSADGVQPDWVRIGGTSGPTVQIAAYGSAACGGGTCINYATNTIKLASSASWNSGDPVYLYKNASGTQVLFGANPDMGALPSTSSSGSGPTPPTGLTAAVQ